MLIKGVGQAGSGVTQEVTQLVSGADHPGPSRLGSLADAEGGALHRDIAHQLHALAATSSSGAIVAGRMGQKIVPLAQRPTSALSVGSAGEKSPEPRGVQAGKSAGLQSRKWGSGRRCSRTARMEA